MRINLPTLFTLLVLVAGVWVIAQIDDEDTDTSEVDCHWEFKHDPIHSAGAGGGGGGGGGGGSDISPGPIPAFPVAPRTISITTREGFFYDACNGLLYRVNHDSSTGVATATKVELTN